MANRKDLRSEIYHELGDLGQSTVPPALVNEHLNRGIREFNRRVRPTREPVTVTVAEDALTADLAADYGGITLWYSDDGTKRYPISIEDIYEGRNNNLRNPDNKSFVAQEGRTLYFYPAITADEAGSAVAILVQDPPEFSDDTTDLSSTIDPQAVVDWTLHRLLRRKDQEASNGFLVLFLEGVVEAKAARSENTSTSGAVAGNEFFLPRD
jgi:hypothetical protein